MKQEQAQASFFFSPALTLLGIRASILQFHFKFIVLSVLHFFPLILNLKIFQITLVLFIATAMPLVLSC